MAKVKFPSEMPSANNIGGNDKMMIAKEGTGETYQATFDQAKQYLTIEGQRIASVAPGALPAGPAGQTRYMEVTAVGTWTYGGSPVGSNADGFRTTFWWTGDAWVDNGSVKVQGPMPTGTDSLEPELIPKGKAIEAYVEPLYSLTASSVNLIDNTKIISGGYRITDGSIAESNNLIRTPLIPLKEGETKLSVSGVGLLAGANARLAFFSSPSVAIFQTQDMVGVDIPPGAKYVGVTIHNGTNVGLDPTNSVYKNTMMLNYGSTALPHTPYEYKVDGSKVQGVPPEVASQVSNINQDITSIDSRLALLEASSGKEYEYKFNLDGYFATPNSMLINTDGDYIEFTARIETLTGNNQIRMFGESGTTVRNNFGFYTNMLRLRGDVNSEPWTEFTSLPSFADYHTYKLVVNGSNWDLYVDGVLNQSKPKPSGLLVNTIGNAFTITLPFWLKGNVNIKAGGVDYTFNNFSQYSPNIEAIELPKKSTVLSNVYVTYNPTGYNGRKFFQVFVRKGNTNRYIGFRMNHYYNESLRYDYIRIDTATEYEFDGSAMSAKLDNALTAGESEFTMQLTGKNSHTGGAHGFERMNVNGFTFYMNGVSIDLDKSLTLEPCDSAYYVVESKINNSPNSDASPNPDIDLFNHTKKTYFNWLGQTCVIYNSITPLQEVSVRYMYTGIVCLGRNYAMVAEDDEGNSVALGDSTGQKLKGTGNKKMTFYNPNTGGAVEIESISIIPNDKLGTDPEMWIQDRNDGGFNDSKYYRINYKSGDRIIGVSDTWTAINKVKYL